MATRAKARRAKASRNAKSRPAAKAKRSARAVRKAPTRAKKAAAWTPPTGPGTFCWTELMTTDTEAAKSFYGSLFGWTAKDMSTASTGPYAVLSRGADGVAGLQPVNGAWNGGRPLWLPSVAVDDVDATVAQATALGAAVLHPPSDVAGYGRYAVIGDPQGAILSLWRSKP